MDGDEVISLELTALEAMGVPLELARCPSLGHKDGLLALGTVGHVRHSLDERAVFFDHLHHLQWLLLLLEY